MDTDKVSIKRQNGYNITLMIISAQKQSWNGHITNMELCDNIHNISEMIRNNEYFYRPLSEIKCSYSTSRSNSGAKPIGINVDDIEEDK